MMHDVSQYLQACRSIIFCASVLPAGRSAQRLNVPKRGALQRSAPLTVLNISFGLAPSFHRCSYRRCVRALKTRRRRLASAQRDAGWVVGQQRQPPIAGRGNSVHHMQSAGALYALHQLGPQGQRRGVVVEEKESGTEDLVLSGDEHLILSSALDRDL